MKYKQGFLPLTFAIALSVTIPVNADTTVSFSNQNKAEVCQKMNNYLNSGQAKLNVKDPIKLSKALHDAASFCQGNVPAITITDNQLNVLKENPAVKAFYDASQAAKMSTMTEAASSAPFLCSSQYPAVCKEAYGLEISQPWVWCLASTIGYPICVITVYSIIGTTLNKPMCARYGFSSPSC